MTSQINKFLIDEYQAGTHLKDSAMERLDSIESRFITSETPRYKQRMLDIYSKVSSNQYLTLKNILSEITYGPVALHGIPLIANNKAYIGSALYYRYRFIPSFDSSVMEISYKDDNGHEVIKVYKQGLNESAKVISDAIPLHWMVGLEEIEGGFEGIMKNRAEGQVDGDMRLIAFLGQNADIATFGDLHGAITDYYDIREKLSGGTEYYWVSSAAAAGAGGAPAAVNTAQLVEQLREATETYTNDSVHDLQNSDWQCIQSLLQKALIALQGSC
jgi:hypothetical protein